MSIALRFAPEVRDLLRAALVDEGTLVQALRKARGERRPGDDGMVRYRCQMPVRRPLDPEFVQLVQVEVLVRTDGEAWEVVAVKGLEIPEP
jgi:hypothetical protein